MLQVDYHAVSIAVASHALVTCIGTCGAEYAHLGVPCILAGDNMYSHCGFTYTARSRQEYYDLLANVASLPRLTPEQMLKAKEYNFFRLVMTSSLHSELYPATDENVLGDADGSRSLRMLQELYEKIQKLAPEGDRLYPLMMEVIATDREYILAKPQADNGAHAYAGRGVA